MKTKPNIVMLANAHPPFDTRIFVKEACSLVKAGYSVSIILPHTHNEEKDGVKIIATPVRPGWRRLIITPFDIFFKAMAQPRGSVFHIHDSEILHVGLHLRLFGKKVIYDAHEDTPRQISYQHWIPKWMRKPYATFYFLVEKLCGWVFNKIIVAEPVIAHYFPWRKTFLIRNFPSVESFRNHKAVPYKERNAWLTYVGALTVPRGLYEMLEGAKLAAPNTSFEFVLGGRFSPPSLEADVQSKYKVNFVGWVQYPQLVETLFQSRIGIIIPEPNERYKTNYPVKMFEFMAAGLPVIASKEGESAAFVNECNGGILVDPKNVKEIADAITWLFTHADEAEQMGKRGQAMIFSKYNWEAEERALLKLYEGLGN
jgi:glycosyltransferase involved in cell wall biosynthesis